MAQLSSVASAHSVVYLSRWHRASYGACRIHGRRFEPAAYDGDVAIYDLDLKPLPGDLVAVRRAAGAFLGPVHVEWLPQRRDGAQVTRGDLLLIRWRLVRLEGTVTELSRAIRRELEG